MNLIGLILIAALSGFIVAVSLRLQLRQSSVEAAEGERLHESDARRHGSSQARLQGAARETLECGGNAAALAVK